jgi:hypothetical protein
VPNGREPLAPAPPILQPQNGFLFLDRAKFADAFAADVARTELLSDSQVPWGMNAPGLLAALAVFASDQVRRGCQVRVRAGYLLCACATRLIPYVRSCRLLAGNAEKT